MDIKIVFAIISVIIGLVGFFPYLRDVILKKTQPHEFTWLIWAITQGTATAALWVGGGGVGVASIAIGTVLVTIIFFLSLRDGKRDITRSDIVVLAMAFSAIVIWWQLDNPLAAVLLVSAIDAGGYIPTFRKSFNNPWSETALTWGAFAVASVFAIFALEGYNLLTVSYLATISLANLALFVFLLIRRQKISRPINVPVKL